MRQSYKCIAFQRGGEKVKRNEDGFFGNGMVERRRKGGIKQNYSLRGLRTIFPTSKSNKQKSEPNNPAKVLDFARLTEKSTKNCPISHSEQKENKIYTDTLKKIRKLMFTQINTMR